MTGASETELGVLGADILERHLEVQDTGRNKGEDQGGDHLTGECMVRLDVGVVCQLQVVRECECLVARDVAEGLEPADCQWGIVHNVMNLHQSVGIALHKRTTNELCEDVHGDLDTRNGLHKTDRNEGDEGHNDTENDDDRGSLGGVYSDSDHPNGSSDDKHDKVDPLGYVLVILSHDSSVDIIAKIGFVIFIMSSNSKGTEHTSPDQFGSRKDLLSMVKNDVRYSCSVKGKVPEERSNITGTDPWLTVGLVFVIIELTVGQDLGDVVSCTHVGEGVIVVDGHVGSVPTVGEPDGGGDGYSDEETDELVHDGESGDRERRQPNREDVPIESGQGVQAKTAERRGDGRQGDIVGSDPGHPREVREGLENETGEEEVTAVREGRLRWTYMNMAEKAQRKNFCLDMV